MPTSSGNNDQLVVVLSWMICQTKCFLNARIAKICHTIWPLFRTVGTTLSKKSNNCLLQLPKSGYRVVSIVRQSGYNCSTRQFLRTIRITFQQKYRVALILRQGGFNSPKGQNMSVNVDHQINLLCDCVFVCLNYFIKCLNQYAHKTN